MMVLRSMKMFVSLITLFFLLDNGLGAPTRGRYMWLKCNPNGKDANCVKQRGPLMEDISGLPAKLPTSALDDVMNTNLALSEEKTTKDEAMFNVEEPMVEVAQDEAYEDDPEGEQAEVEEEAQDEVYGEDPEEDEEEQSELEEEGQDELEAEEEGLEKDEKDQPEVQPVEEHSGEGSAFVPFLSDQGSGEQWFDYSSDIMPRKQMIDQVIPPVQELKEDHLLL